MSSSIPSPACRIAVISYSPRRHLVPIPSSSRIGYRIISQRNPSHAISDMATSAAQPSPRPISSPYLLPAQLPAAPCRQTGRIETRRHPVRYSPRLPAIISPLHLIAPSHRLMRFARCLPALSAARRRHQPSAQAAHPSHQPATSHLVHLPSRPASRSASRRASRLAYLPASFISSAYLPARCLPTLRHMRLIHLIHLIGSSPASHPYAPSDETSSEQTKRRTGWAIDDEARSTTTLDTANAYPRPPYSPYEPHNAPTLPRTRPR